MLRTSAEASAVQNMLFDSVEACCCGVDRHRFSQQDCVFFSEEVGWNKQNSAGGLFAPVYIFRYIKMLRNKPITWNVQRACVVARSEQFHGFHR